MARGGVSYELPIDSLDARLRFGCQAQLHILRERQCQGMD